MVGGGFEGGEGSCQGVYFRHLFACLIVAFWGGGVKGFRGSVSGQCCGIDATFSGGTGAPVLYLKESSEGCNASWDFQDFSARGPSSFVLMVGGLGAKGATLRGPAEGTCLVGVNLLN